MKRKSTSHRRGRINRSRRGAKDRGRRRKVEAVDEVVVNEARGGRDIHWQRERQACPNERIDL